MKHRRPSSPSLIEARHEHVRAVIYLERLTESLEELEVQLELLGIFETELELS